MGLPSRRVMIMLVLTPSQLEQRLASTPSDSLSPGSETWISRPLTNGKEIFFQRKMKRVADVDLSRTPKKPRLAGAFRPFKSPLAPKNTDKELIELRHRKKSLQDEVDIMEDAIRKSKMMASRKDVPGRTLKDLIRTWRRVNQELLIHFRDILSPAMLARQRESLSRSWNDIRGENSCPVDENAIKNAHSEVLESECEESEEAGYDLVTMRQVLRFFGIRQAELLHYDADRDDFEP